MMKDRETAYCWFSPDDVEDLSRMHGVRGVPVRAIQSIMEAAPCALVGLRCARDGQVGAIAVEYLPEDEPALIDAARLVARDGFTAQWRSGRLDAGYHEQWKRTDGVVDIASR